MTDCPQPCASYANHNHKACIAQDPTVASHPFAEISNFCVEAIPLVQAPDEQDKHNDSYALALKHRSVTLKAWSPQPSEGEAFSSAHKCPALSESGPRPVADGQVLEGQGKGLFLGPPAQRWAADAALKESLNR